MPSVPSPSSPTSSVYRVVMPNVSGILHMQQDVQYPQSAWITELLQDLLAHMPYWVIGAREFEVLVRPSCMLGMARGTELTLEHFGRGMWDFRGRICCLERVLGCGGTMTRRMLVRSVRMLEKRKCAREFDH